MNYTDIEADLIIAQAEIARLRAELKKLSKALEGLVTMQVFYPDDTTFYITSQSYTDKLQAQLWDMTARAEKAESDRDAAVAEIYKIAACDACKHYDADKNNCAKPMEASDKCFEWRGIEKGKDDKH